VSGLLPQGHVIPACERVKESHFCVWRGLKSLSLALR
jgi:hypothetical protein